MNGITGTRRSARPVRLALARQLGVADIDGAWWPYTASLADEFPQLIGCLHEPLGEIIDICVNWSATQGPRELYETVSGARTSGDGHPGRQRLMVVEGKLGCANLLVVPHMTSQALGVMVMRRAAARTFSGTERGTDLFEIADCVTRAAQLASASWRRRRRDLAGASVLPAEGV
jgi:hypothetical protein